MLKTQICVTRPQCVNLRSLCHIIGESSLHFVFVVYQSSLFSLKYVPRVGEIFAFIANQSNAIYCK